MKYKYFPASIFSFFVLELIFCKSASKLHLTNHQVLHGNSKVRAEKYIKDVIKTKLEEGPLLATNLPKGFPDYDKDEVKYIDNIDSWLENKFVDYHKVNLITSFYNHDYRILIVHILLSDSKFHSI